MGLQYYKVNTTLPWLRQEAILTLCVSAYLLITFRATGNNGMQINLWMLLYIQKTRAPEFTQPCLTGYCSPYWSIRSAIFVRLSVTPTLRQQSKALSLLLPGLLSTTSQGCSHYVALVLLLFLINYYIYILFLTPRQPMPQMIKIWSCIFQNLIIELNILTYTGKHKSILTCATEKKKTATGQKRTIHLVLSSSGVICSLFKSILFFPNSINAGLLYSCILPLIWERLFPSIYIMR